MKGSSGQFDVVADGTTIASRGDAGFFVRLVGGGFPDEGQTIEKIKARLPASAAPP